MSKKTIVFDFDGVIHKGYEGYKDGSIYGTIDYEILDFIQELMKKYYVVVSSNRSATQIAEYLNKLNYNGLKFETYKMVKGNIYWQKNNIVGVTNDKAIGIIYIDDRGFRYNKEISTKENIQEIKKLLEE